MARVVIVGAGLAGARAVETLRTEGFDGEIVLIGAEPEFPYERPPLSKEWLAGTMPDEKIYLRPREYYAEQGVTLRLGVAAIGLDAEARRVQLAGGDAEPYEHLLIATGATPRRLNVAGADLPGVFYLRDLADGRALKNRLAPGKRLVVIGMGFIGAEVAATARELGLEVTVIEALDRPLARAFPPILSDRLRALHEAHGVAIRLGASVKAFHGAKTVESVQTADGARLAADLVVVGIGVRSDVDWLTGSGLTLNDGVVVDEFCRASAPDVYAVGDVANWPHPELGRRLRVEHFDNAQHQAAAAVRTMLGKGEPYAPPLYFWSDQYDWSLQCLGHWEPDEEPLIRGDLGGASWTAFFLTGDQLHGVVAANRFKDFSAARQLMAKRRPVTAAQLADERVDLRALAKG